MADLFSTLFQRLKLDQVDIDNWNFKLYSKISVGLFFLASVSSIASSYSSNAITCHGVDNDSYAPTYCWLHGAYRINPTLFEKLTKNGERCIKPWVAGDSQDTNKETNSDYYIWVSVVLFMNGALFLIPDQIWKYFEGGMMNQFTRTQNISTEKIRENAITFNRLSNNYTRRYFFTFVGCELFNVFIAIANFVITNKFLSGNFVTYGTDALAYYSGDLKHVEYHGNTENTGKGSIHKDVVADINPMCFVFPTVVNCEYTFGGIIKNSIDEESIICMLGQNIVNQKIYLVLWFWFMVLFVASSLMFLYRILTLSPFASFRRLILQSLAKTSDGEIVNFVPVDYDNIGNWFLLNQIGRNANPYYFRVFLNEWRSVLSAETHSGGERASLLNEEEGANLFNEGNVAAEVIEMPELNGFRPANTS